nr:violaxanthin de-epoxidase, chloroplastic [Tanacetum cinerariifolium]
MSFFPCLPYNNNNNPTTTTLCSVSSSSSVLNNDDDDVRIVAIVGEGAISPLKSASWTNVLLHTADRLKWVNESYEMLVFTDDVLESNAALQKELTSANILLIVSLTKQESVEWIQSYSRNIRNIVCFDSSPVLQNKLGGSCRIQLAHNSLMWKTLYIW